MYKYAIWDKQSPIITPIGEVLSAEQWMARYPIAKLDSITVVCAAGEINGGFFGTLGQMKDMYAHMGIDFSGCETDEDYLNAIEAFEDEDRSTGESSPEERIAAALEYNNLINSPVINSDDPDFD